MVANDQPTLSYSALLKTLDDMLGIGEFNNDVRKSAEIALELCELVSPELDP